MNSPSDIDLLLIGKTGNGKSATGNSILQCKAFKSISSTSSVTMDIQFGMGKVGNRVIKVVDGPGIGDTRMDSEKAKRLVKNKLEYAIALNPHGYQALLVVVKYGCTFTEEGKETIKFLKGLFGNTFMKDYGILVMTCGDSFENEPDRCHQSFKQWCKEQTGEFAGILEECHGRIVLFDNRTQDKLRQASQLNALMDLVDDIQTQRGPYTDQNFELACSEKEKLLANARRPLITEKMLKEAGLILQELTYLQSKRLQKEWLPKLETLMIKAEALHSSVETLVRNIGDLKDMLEHTAGLKYNISQEIKLSVKRNAELQTEEEIRSLSDRLRLIDLTDTYSAANRRYTDDLVEALVTSVTFQWKN